ncbi:MAG: glycoside hydrolase family 13 protein [Tannerellaceae bacterium]|jgi:glycosidase|nr:glycoside hydrolase family 13 protein [Tannerellaceae bacterium]
MNKKIILIFLFPFFILDILIAREPYIDRIEPLFWWCGMKNPELQIMVYGKDIAKSKIKIDYPNVRIKEVVNVENSNYLFIYLEIEKEATPGTMQIEFNDGKKTVKKAFELKPRETKPGAMGFSAKDVMYLITPDRFSNADTSNDNSDTVKVNRDRPNSRHGGDIRGIIDKLEYIDNLGFTTIWLNPVQENRQQGGSYHGYAITDFYQVDSRLGTNEEYCELIDKAHTKGMKIVMDMIFNHCGSGHWWLRDLPSSDWLNNKDNFVQTNHYKWTLMDIHASESEKDVLINGWFSRGMPDLNQRNRHLATYLIQNSIWWIEYARIDGIRQDTHPYADYDFMSRWCKEISGEYPDFNIVGEAWYPRITASAWWQQNSKNNKQNTNLKTVMDFDLSFTCEKAFTDESASREGTEAGLFKLYEVIAQDYLFADPDNILIFLDNHDLGRFMKKDETDLRRYKQALSFLLTTRGIPQIYYGTEILMYGEKKEGDGNIRKDFPGGWKEDLTNAFTPEGRSVLQNEAWNFMQKLLQWRKTNKTVTEGSLIHYTPDRTGCYVYARIKDKDVVLIMLNGTNKEQSVSMKRFHEVLGNKTLGKDLLTGQSFSLTTSINLPPRGVYILELQ